MALGTAMRAFFGSLFNSETSARVQAALDAKSNAKSGPARITTTEPAKAKPVPQAPARSDAIALLASLQREARLMDLIQEKLESFSDAQVGAAARPCLQQCAATLQRVMGLKAVVDEAEGDSVEVPSDASAATYQWIGEGTGTSGQLIHRGWQATKVELPKWTGSASEANVIAPAQVKRP